MSKFNLVRLMWYRNKVKWKYRTVSGTPPLTFKAKKAGTLKNYRIYGDTVNGESVGDLVTSGDHAGEYKVPVTVEGKNLFDKSKPANILKCYLAVSTLVSNVDTRTIFIECKPSTTYTVSKIQGERFVVGWSDKLPAPGVELQEKVINYNASSITITTGLAAKYLVAYIYNGQDAPITVDEMIASVQIEKGSTATPYEPYRTPITTPIYLPEPIKMVGDEAEYIDFMEQKQHFADGTSVDVNLPALPTLSGTNTLTVGTEVQPSKVYLKGKIEEIPTRTVSYYSQDGSTLLGTETVESGGNASGLQDTPTKPDTEQYTYTFVGWSNTANATTAMSGILNNITADKSVYAAFSETARTYTVYFYNGETLLETVTGVPSGGTATYTGATPTSSQAGYIFSGWSPSNTNITADTSCYAQFKEDEMYESITDTWSEIIANVSNGTYSTKYHVGDTKKIDLGTEGEVIMTIVGIDTDDLADNSGKAPITWISKQLLKTSRRMNPVNQSGTSGTGSLGGWEVCEMRSYLKETVKPLLPPEVRNALKTVKKYSRIYNTSETAVNNVVSNDEIWIPSAYEANFTGYETSGVTYSTAFPDNASRIKHKVGGAAAWWWLRSADGTNRFRLVRIEGSANGFAVGNSGGVAVGFVI